MNAKQTEVLNSIKISYANAIDAAHKLVIDNAAMCNTQYVVCDTLTSYSPFRTSIGTGRIALFGDHIYTASMGAAESVAADLREHTRLMDIQVMALNDWAQARADSLRESLAWIEANI